MGVGGAVAKEHPGRRQPLGARFDQRTDGVAGQGMICAAHAVTAWAAKA